ncbi:sugar ABC transporter substrate-binding protein [Pseudodesulfovibrio portus]|uniref:Sugar ABC transporter substrate-binding protein n=2 Tax=Pseudodesulfovibrio portus TaxID=231439 RepID=A0ABM8ASS5_9BACT|nr:sugar ABC transporter substrate-binding protein [Pseudodesulfovibrio portus]
MSPARAVQSLCLAVVAVLLTGAPCLGEGKLFAIVAKSVSDQNFVRIYEAARVEAEENGDRIILVGGTGKAHFRIQDAQVQKVLELKPNGLAISVLHSCFLAENSFKAVRAAGIPVVTFDSDFSGDYTHLRAGYVGTDNMNLGVLLALEARRLMPKGGRFAILTGGPDDTNLIDRIKGVLLGLDTGGKQSSWTQYQRSPLPCRDNYDQALDQLEVLLEDPTIDAIISVGWWAQMAQDYERRISPYKPLLDSRKKILLFAGAAPRQRELLDQGLNHVNIGLNFEEMGRMVYRALSQLSQGNNIPSTAYSPIRIYRCPPVTDSYD